MSRSEEPADHLGLKQAELEKAEQAWGVFSGLTLPEKVKPCTAHRIETLKEASDSQTPCAKS
jgi:hypothetical protein